MSDFLVQQGNYRDLIAYKKAECIYDITFHFAHRFLKAGDRTMDQMIQAARSGKQNIAEGSSASTTSRETEIKLMNVAKASFQELLLDYEDYLRVRDLEQWSENSAKALQARIVCSKHNDSAFYRNALPKRTDEAIANIAITLLHQEDVFLRKLINRLKSDFIKKGGIREEMNRARRNYRNNENNKQ
jgi:four helix bundle suffix protein